MTKLVNRAKITTATTGTGTITLGSAVDGYQTFAAAGVVNSDVVRYTIEDGDAWEIGSGTYSTGTLTRVLDESSTGSLLNLSGDAVVYVTAAGEDIQQPPSEGPFVDGDKTKLDGIEAGATADQTAGEIKTAYESNANTNAFTDAEQTKLAGIEATADVTDAGNVNPLVDAHLNTSSATTGEYLSWTGSDYDWVAASGYTNSDVDTHLNTGTASASEVLSWTGSDYDWVAVSGYTDADVDTHLNTGTASSGEVLSWNGSDYDWITSGGAFSVVGTNNLAAITTLPSITTGANNFVAGNSANSLSTGSSNVSFAGGLGSITTGTGNFAYRGLFNLTTASNNIALGAAAGNQITTSPDNIIIGTNAMRDGDGGSGYHVVLGNFAGQSIAGGALRNVAIGEESVKNSNGAYNIGIGYNATSGAGAGTFTGAHNIGAGEYPLLSLTSGSYNIALGSRSGFDLSTGSNNFLGGYQAGTNLTTGSNNVALGNGALDAATTGGRNVAIGQDAMGLGVATTASGDNIAIGYRTGYNITTGSDNISLGEFAGFAMNTASENVVIGRVAGQSITNGTFNTLVGSACGGNLTASGVSALGYLAALNITDGLNATAIGREALRGNLSLRLTGQNNVGVGYLSGTGLSTGAENTLIGTRAGLALTTGSSNVHIGAKAGDATTTGSNQIVIGYTADPSSATVSNEITLGNSSITRFRIPGAGIDNTSDALSGTTPSVDVGARDTYTLTTSGNTTFTFTGAPSSGQVGTFSLIVTAGGTHTLTWPASVDWAGGTAPDAPASGEKDIYTFMTVDGGTQWYGFLAGDAMA